MGQQIQITGYMPTRFISVTSAATFNVATTVPFSQQLTSDLPGATWGKVGGLDAALFTLTAAGLLTMAAKVVGSPVDSNADNVYEVTVEARDPQYGFAKLQQVRVTVTP